LLAGWVFGLTAGIVGSFLLVLGILIVASIIATFFALASSGAGEEEVACYFGWVGFGMWVAEAIAAAGALLRAELGNQVVKRALLVLLGNGVYELVGPPDSKLPECF
jgi:hypothetical protein